MLQYILNAYFPFQTIPFSFKTLTIFLLDKKRCLDFKFCPSRQLIIRRSLPILLLLLSAFPFSQGWPQRNIILQTFLSLTSVSFAPTSPISSFTTSKNLLFGLPLLLFPGNSISIIFLPTYSLSLLMTCLYHFSLPPSSSFLTVLP